MSDIDKSVISAKVLTVSDGVIAGTREDRSGEALVALLADASFDVVDRRAVGDGVEAVSDALVEMASGFVGVIVTTGGTGFGPRDLTPEATSQVVERVAPGLAEAMRLVNPLGRLSRGVAGTLGLALIINSPGSPKGAVETVGAVIDVLPHAVRLMAAEPTDH